METSKKYLSVHEAATDYFDGLISPASLYNLIKANKIKTIKLRSRILIPITELDQYTTKQLGDKNYANKL